MATDKKCNITLRGAIKEFTESIAEKHFDGNVSKTIRWCVGYTMRRSKLYDVRIEELRAREESTGALNAKALSNFIGSKNRYLCTRWFDLPKSRIGDAVVAMNGSTIDGTEVIDSEKKTIYLTEELMIFLTAYTNAMGTRMSREITRKIGSGRSRVIKASKEIDYRRYPQLGGMIRNAIYQCLYMLMYDIIDMSLSGQAFDSIETIERHYNVWEDK